MNDERRCTHVLEDGGEEVVQGLGEDLGPLLLEVGRKHVVGLWSFHKGKS